MEKDFRLGQWTVRPALNKLESGTRAVSVEPRVMDLLVYLVKHAGEVVPKEQIINDVWGGAFVTDQALTYAVTELRRALGDSAHAPKFVRTVPKRGYQLIGGFSEIPVKETRVSAGPSAGRSGVRKNLILAGIGLLILTIGYVLLDRLKTERALQPSLAQLTFGEGLQTQATWSPDGRFVAFAWNRNGNFDLWIQSLNGLEPIRLTEHPADDTQPSWSPDGRELVFRSERDGGGLYLVPAFGGPVRRLCAFGLHPAWSPDGGSILFSAPLVARLRGRQLYVTNRDGGVPQPTAAEFGAEDVSWHPGGQYISLHGLNLRTLSPGLHLIPLEGGDPMTLHVGSQSSPERLLNVSSIRWAPTGDEVYFVAHSEGVSNLWRLPIDADRFVPRGQAQRLTRGANLDTDIAVSPAGQRLAFTSQTRRSRTWEYPFDIAEGRVTGKGRPVGPLGLNVLVSELSPQGDRLLLVGSKAAAVSAVEDREICAVSLTGDQQVLSIDHGRVWGPSWSRDGKFLVYSIMKAFDEQGHSLTGGEYAVVMQPSGGGSKRMLIHGKERHFAPEDWSHDGRWLLCSTRDLPESQLSARILRLLATDGSQRTSGVLFSNPDFDLAGSRFSPDGRWIGVVALSTKDRETARLFLAPAGGGQWIPLVPEEDNVGQIHWSPDGRLIYCAARREAGTVLLAVPVDLQSGRQREPSREIMDLDEFGCLPEDSEAVGFCVAPGHLVVQKIERTGNIWLTTTRPD